MQIKVDVIEELQESLEAAEEELLNRQQAMEDCQDMCAEMQAFAETKHNEVIALRAAAEVRNAAHNASPHRNGLDSREDVAVSSIWNC